MTNCPFCKNEMKSHDELGHLCNTGGCPLYQVWFDTDDIRVIAETITAAQAEKSQQLSSLLAIVHRDGGHYEAEHGTEKAYLQAREMLPEMIQSVAAARAQALQEAAQIVAWNINHDREGATLSEIRALAARPGAEPKEKGLLT